MVVVVGLLIHVKGRDGGNRSTRPKVFPFSYSDVARVLWGVGGGLMWCRDLTAGRTTTTTTQEHYIAGHCVSFAPHQIYPTLLYSS